MGGNCSSVNILHKERNLNKNYCVAEHPHEEKMNRTDYGSILQYEGYYDPEAEEFGLEDKLEVETVRKYLWQKGKLCLKKVCKWEVAYRH